MDDELKWMMSLACEIATDMKRAGVHLEDAVTIGALLQALLISELKTEDERRTATAAIAEFIPGMSKRFLDMKTRYEEVMRA